MLTLHTWLDIVLVTFLAVLLHHYWTSWNDDVTAHIELSAHRQRLFNNRELYSKESQIVSSVWCFGSHHTNRMCYFHNLCYLPDVDEFVFLHGNHSVYVGVPENRYDPTLLDMSSVRDHNTQYFNFMDADSAEMSSVVGTASIVEQTTLIFRRFHPDNLMHVLHDDLLPLFHTVSTLPFATNNGLNKISSPFDLQLLFTEGWDPGPFDVLYTIFSSVKPLYKANISSVDHPTCFSEAYVGISKYTTWYQYGFVEPQGPLSDIRVTADDIRHFCNFVRLQLNVSEVQFGDGHVIVLLSRRYNRLILNEVDLAFALAQKFNQKVVTIAMETHSLRDMISVVSKANILIGMHGSLLTLSMFLPPGSTIVELFPYAINPLHYTPYQTLASLTGMNIKYLSWQNMDVAKTVSHAERSWEEGGIVHLSEDEQQQITSSHEVPLHLCCRNAEWLYRIYQDTVVDVVGIINLLLSNGYSVKSPLTADQPHISHDTHGNGVKQLFPSHVRNIVCTGNSVVHGLPALHLSWQAPANVKYIRFVEMKYEVWIQKEGEEDYTAWMLTQYQYTFTAGIERETIYNVWIRCILDGTVGPFNMILVSCSTQAL